MSGVQEIITLRPGMVANIQVGSLDGRPTFVEYSHEDILALLVRKNPGRSRASKTPEAKASRQIALLARAIETGKWATGAPIASKHCYHKLIQLVRSLPDPQLLTLRARTAIEDLLASEDHDTVYDRGDLRKAYERV